MVWQFTMRHVFLLFIPAYLLAAHQLLCSSRTQFHRYLLLWWFGAGPGAVGCVRPRANGHVVCGRAAVQSSHAQPSVLVGESVGGCGDTLHDALSSEGVQFRQGTEVGCSHCRAGNAPDPPTHPSSVLHPYNTINHSHDILVLERQSLTCNTPSECT